jgi:glycogen debranching enzyme
MLLREAQQNGLDVADLRPNLMAAARWLLEYADADGDGFLEYIDEAGTGLANQGWKDSGDSIRFADGTIADAPIALAEVQGYAYRAALDAASLLEDWADGGTVGEGEAEGSDLPASLRFWAENLRERFRDSFWCEDEAGRYVALALDGQKKSVDGVASNMGHLLGTGILEPAEARVVVDRLMSPEMFSGYGIRTLSTDNAAYWPQRYHGGSVWTHDTGYILRQMWRAGFTDEARVLARGLIRAADGFDQRLPELFSGEGPEFADPPIPYPASCRPQAWAAASAVVVAEVVGE